ncbi:threonine ammonia-lyase [Clostridia bacterium]|nr:threonine ammonia-lyase [Clostridia bacterium]
MSETLTVRDVEIAAERLTRVIHRTPLERSETFSEMAGADIYLKFENQQKTGSFKIRGAYNKISEIVESGSGVKEVVAASAGNHAQGVAFASRKLGIHAAIVMPKSTPIAKVKATEGYGAEVVLAGSGYDEAYAAALEIQSSRNATFIHPFDDNTVIAGQGTIAHEILRDLPNVDVVFIPAGGGGLLAGMAFYLKNVNPRVKIIGVQAEGAPAIAKSYHGDEADGFKGTIADGIAVRNPGTLTRELIQKYADDVVTVSDAEISSAILNLLERCKQIVEPAGAASLAAALRYSDEYRGKRCVSILSGGNIDVGFIHRIIEIGLAARCRKLKFSTVMPDLPGSLEKFSKIMADAGANIVMVQYDRMSAELDPHEVILHIACEVGGREHGEAVQAALERGGYKINIS